MPAIKDNPDTQAPEKKGARRKVPPATPTPSADPLLQVKPADPPRPPEPVLPSPEVDRPSTEPITAWEEMLVQTPGGGYRLFQPGEVIPIGSCMGDGSTIKPPMTDSLGRVSRPVTRVLPGATEEDISRALEQGMVLDSHRPVLAMPHPNRGPEPGVRGTPPPTSRPSPLPSPLPGGLDGTPHPARGGPPAPAQPARVQAPPPPVESFSEPPPPNTHPTIVWPPGNKITPTLEGLPLRQGDPIEFVHRGKWVGGYAIVEDKGPNQRMIGAYLAGRPMGASPANGERVPIPPSTPAYHGNPKGYSFIPGNHNSLREGGALPTGASLTRYPVLVRLWEKEPGEWVRGALSRPQDDRVVFVSEAEIKAGKGPWDIPGRLATDAAVHFPEDSKFCDWANVVASLREPQVDPDAGMSYSTPPRPGSFDGAPLPAPVREGRTILPQGSPLPSLVVAMPPAPASPGASVFSPTVLSPEVLTRMILATRARFHGTPLLVQRSSGEVGPVTDAEICDLAVLLLGVASMPS